jgi:hypothetical protein
MNKNFCDDAIGVLSASMTFVDYPSSPGAGDLGNGWFM